jgi:flagellar protein FlgJ
MNTSTIHSLTPVHQKSDARATPTAVSPEALTPTAEQRQVAQQFEAIFMRQLLGSLEQSGGLGGDSTGGGVYRSMMVGALADNTASGGGIGLAELVLKAMVPEPAVPRAVRDLSASAPRDNSVLTEPGDSAPTGKSDVPLVGIPLSSPAAAMPLSAAPRGIPLSPRAPEHKPLIKPNHGDLR